MITELFKGKVIGCERIDTGIDHRKIDICIQQIDCAIFQLFSGNWASAITLAGAVESSLPPAEDDADFWKGMLAAGEQLTGKNKKDIADSFNDIRNWLKHPYEQNGEPILQTKKIRQFDVVLMLFRASIRLYQTSKLKTPAILAFEEWYKQNYQTWPEPLLLEG